MEAVMKALVPFTFALAVALTGCSKADPPPRSTASVTNADATPCPLGVRGAHVIVEDTEVGVTMTFTAPATDLPDLRERARDAAAMHGPGQHLGKGHDGQHFTGGDHGLKAMQLPPSFAGEEDIDGGARIRFMPADPADLDLLRTRIRERAGAMMNACR
jgi:hypothetical protein